MMFTEKIPKKIIDGIRAKKWHRHGIYRNNIMQGAFVTAYLGKEWYRREGVNIGISNLICLGDEYYIDHKEYERLVRYFKKKISPKFLERYLKKYKEDNDKMLTVARAINRVNPKRLSNDELAGLFRKFFEKSRELIHWLWSMEFLNSALDEFLAEEISRKNEDANKEMYYLSFIPKKLDFQKEIEEIVSLPNLNGKKIAVLYEKYNWLRMNFWDGEPMTISEYKERARNIFSRKKEILQKNKDEEKNRKEFRKFVTRIKGVKLIEILKISQELIYLKTQRIDVFTISWKNILPLVREILARKRLKIEELHRMTEHEIIELLRNPKTKFDLKIRKKYAILRLNDMNYYYCGKAHDILFQYLRRNVGKEYQEISGHSAYPGVIKGKVKVVMTDRDLHKVKKGEIIVANLTKPNYDSVFSKVIAIITDEGGLLCHSAIIARELRIPTIIGTRIATQVLKDGDLVEVDANRGVVKILKRKK